MTTALIVVAAALAAGYLLLRFNRLWIGLFDRARRNGRDSLPAEYERPRYYRLDSRGEPDYTARWPGWDGWYFFVIPSDRSLPVKMLRASIMTGLYGLEGIDNYDKLSFRLDSRDGIETLSLTPTEAPGGGEALRRNYLSQRYLPRKTDLKMQIEPLSVEAICADPDRDDIRRPFAHIAGGWPDYRFEFTNAESGIDYSFAYTGRKILWWADIPGVFTYFAAIGALQGTVAYRDLSGNRETYPVQGYGCFEHGFARKVFDFDPLFTPVRLLKRIAPSWKPIRYHYELFMGDDEVRGGFMQARGFGIDWRNLGGIHDPAGYASIRSVRIEYTGEFDAMVNCSGDSTFEAPRSWRVSAKTDRGELAYSASREFPPSTVADNMTFYTFSYEGTFAGSPIRGRGYGEYVHL
jgi:hypothetical protein